MCDKKCSNCGHHKDQGDEHGMVFCQHYYMAVYGGSVACSNWTEIVEIW